MEDTGSKCADTHCNEHETKLGNCRVCENSFNVILSKTDGRGEDRR